MGVQPATLRAPARSFAWAAPLLPVALSVFFASALVYYHVQVRLSGFAADGLFQACVVGLYELVGFVPSFMFCVLALVWSSIWFISGKLEHPWARLGRILTFTLALALMVNLQQEGVPTADHGGAVGGFLATRLQSVFGYGFSTLLAALIALAAMLLATDFFFFRYFDSMQRGNKPRPASTPALTGLTPAVMAGDDDVAIATESGVENLAVEELRRLHSVAEAEEQVDADKHPLSSGGGAVVVDFGDLDVGVPEEDLVRVIGGPAAEVAATEVAVAEDAEDSDDEESAAEEVEEWSEEDDEEAEEDELEEDEEWEEAEEDEEELEDDEDEEDVEDEDEDEDDEEWEEEEDAEDEEEEEWEESDEDEDEDEEWEEEEDDEDIDEEDEEVDEELEDEEEAEDEPENDEPTGSEQRQGQLFFDASKDQELVAEATELVLGAGRATAGLLQRRLRIGYGEALEILDVLREREVIDGEVGTPSGRVLEASHGASAEADE